MPHDICIEGNTQPRGTNAARLVLIAALLGTIFWFGIEGVEAPALPQGGTTAPSYEDWHGNVRRSHWGNP